MRWETEERVGGAEVEAHGPFAIHGEREIVSAMDSLLMAFVEQNRMKLQGDYSPCYQLVS